jgi:hypothetical protein
MKRDTQHCIAFVVMLSDIHAECCKQALCADRRYADCRGAIQSIHLSYCGADVGISASLANASATTFQLPTLKHVKTCIDMTKDAKHFISMFLKEKHL